ncbi:MAG TPA: hypothetical protein PK468_24220 [Candidatus Hydrogenedentes bacterium]|nr:hypothetical protein [Candidatus Hydrogenedentota bacterium]
MHERAYHHLNAVFSTATLMATLLIAGQAVSQGTLQPVLQGQVYTTPVDVKGLSPADLPDVIRAKHDQFRNGFALNLAGMPVDQYGNVKFQVQEKPNFLLDADKKAMSMYFTQAKPVESSDADKISARADQLKRASQGMSGQEVTSILGKYDDMFQRISPDTGFEEAWLYVRSSSGSEMAVLWFDSKGVLLRVEDVQRTDNAVASLPAREIKQESSKPKTPEEKTKALSSLKVGMSRDEVRNIMGDADSVDLYGGTVKKNPEEKWHYGHKTLLFDSKEDRLKRIK